jgi:uncharacterized protein YqeY
MDSSLKAKIQEDTKEAMKQGLKEKVITLRSLYAAIRKHEIDKQELMTDDDILGLLSKQVKTRNESIEAFRKGNRDDLIEKEQAELDILYQYLPKQLSEEEIAKHVEQAIAHTNATSIKDMGTVMQKLRENLTGVADMQLVSSLVKKQLSI